MLRRWCGRLLVLTVGTTSVVSLGAGSADAALDASAGATLHGAAVSMQRASGYRFVATVGTAPNTVRLVGEFQAPDRVHQTVTVPGGSGTEIIFIGADEYTKDPKTGTWHGQPQTGTQPSTDVRSAFGALTNAGSVHRHGLTYSFELPAQASRALLGVTSTAPVAGSAQITGGQIVGLTYRAVVSGRALTVRISYSDINRAPSVQPPVS